MGGLLLGIFEFFRSDELPRSESIRETELEDGLRFNIDILRNLELDNPNF